MPERKMVKRRPLLNIVAKIPKRLFGLRPDFSDSMERAYKIALRQNPKLAVVGFRSFIFPSVLLKAQWNPFFCSIKLPFNFEKSEARNLQRWVWQHDARRLEKMLGMQTGAMTPQVSAVFYLLHEIGHANSDLARKAGDIIDDSGKEKKQLKELAEEQKMGPKSIAEKFRIVAALYRKRPPADQKTMAYARKLVEISSETEHEKIADGFARKLMIEQWDEIFPGLPKPQPK